MKRPLVLDTTCLTHFARAGRLDTLEAISGGCERLVTPEVIQEALDGLVAHPAIGNLGGQQWFKVVELDINEAVRAALFKSELGGSPRKHLGECETLAVAQCRDGVAVIDDADGRRLGVRHSVTVAGTLSIVARAVKTGSFDVAWASALVDDLRGTDMYLPTDGQGFESWAKLTGLL